MTDAEPKCVNAHDRCFEGGPCPLCEARPRRTQAAERIKELEAENAALQDLAGRLRVEMSDMLTRLKEKYPDEFVGLEDGDEPTDEDAYGWGCQEWGVPG